MRSMAGGLARMDVRGSGDRQASSRSPVDGRVRGHRGESVHGSGACEGGGAGAMHGRHLHGCTARRAVAPSATEPSARHRKGLGAWQLGCAAAGVGEQMIRLGFGMTVGCYIPCILGQAILGCLMGWKAGIQACMIIGIYLGSLFSCLFLSLEDNKCNISIYTKRLGPPRRD